MSKIYKLLILAVILTISTGSLAQSSSAGKPTIKGNVFGGGRMANVGKTDATADTTAIIDIYASTIKGGVFGGNDITGAVVQASGDDKASAKITIHDACDATCSVKEVYGGGNGYYKYKIGDTTIEIGTITDENKESLVAANTLVEVLDTVGTKVAEFYTSATAATTYAGLLPALGNTSVTIGETANAKNNIALAEVYGGAKNAYVTGSSSVTVNSGTMGRVFAGNNVGGYSASSSLTINGTKSPTTEPTADDFANFDWANIGVISADVEGNYSGFGIGEAYGGGNAVDVLSEAVVEVNGGYVGSLFGGNNLADMAGVPTVNLKGGKIHTVYGGGNAGDMKGVEGYLLGMGTYLDESLINNWTGLKQTIDDKASGFAMNRFPAFMSTIVSLDATAGTDLLVGNVYGGCRAANVDYSSYIRISNAAYVGDVYGGCDMAGAVGVGPMDGDSANYKAPRDLKCKVYDYDQHKDILAEDYTFPSPPATGANYTVKQGTTMYYVGTYVTMTGGTVNGKIFGGGDGEYTYTESSDNWEVKEVGKENILATIPQSKGKPWVVGANVIIEGGTINDNVYLGGNEAPVGKDYTSVAEASKPTFYGKSVTDYLAMPSYLLIGHTVRTQTNTVPIKINNEVYCGGRKADVYSVVDALIKNNVEVNRFFAGNDISRHVKGTNRTSYPYYPQAAEGAKVATTHLVGGTDTYSGESLAEPFNNSKNKPQVYVRVEGAGEDVQHNMHPAAKITTLFGGGNGDYGDADATGKYTSGTYLNLEKPTQKSSWLDIKGIVGTSFGGGNAAEVDYANTYITGDAQVGTAFGGGNSATVSSSAMIYLDCDGTRSTDSTFVTDNTKTPNVGTIFGGNNVADMKIVPWMELHRGSVKTVYGGGNEGDMLGHEALFVDGSADLNPAVFNHKYPTYAPDSVLLFAATDVMIDSKYKKDTEGNEVANDGLVVGDVYGGCKAANVNNSSYMRITHAQYIGNVYGGCDVSGSVGFKPDTLASDMVKDGKMMVYFTNGKPATEGVEIDNSLIGTPLYNASTYVLMTGGTVHGNVYGGGNGDYDYSSPSDGSTNPLAGVSAPFVAATTINIVNGTIKGNLYGGGNKAEVGHIFTEAGSYMGKSYNAGDTLTNMSYIYLGHGASSKSVTVEGSVYGGCKMANVYGAIDILALKDVEIDSLFAGNDISGSVQGNWRGTRFSRESSNITSLKGTTDTQADCLSFSGQTLTGVNANVYVRVMPGAKINTLFGGGNGAYDYENTYSGLSKPMQQSSFVDVAGHVTTAYGGGNAADIGTSNLYIVKNAQITTAFAGGNSATVTNEANLIVDCNPALYVAGTNSTSEHGYIIDETVHNPATTSIVNNKYNVTTLFGGNNVADMAIVPNVQLFHGKIGTVYGGGKAGNMTGVQGYLLGFSTYLNDHLLNSWSKVGKDDRNSEKADGFQMSRFPVFIGTNVTFDAKAATTTASGYTTKTGLRVDKTYGGCQAADVKNSTYIRVSAADYVGDVYGGCDIAGGVGTGPLGDTQGTNYTAPDDLRCWVYDNATDKDVYADTWQFPSDDEGVRKHYTVEKGTVMRYVSTYVTFTGGEIRGKVYGGGNGAYDYTSTKYSSYADNQPWVVGANVIVEGGTFYDNIYLGGNAATVGKNLGTGSGKYFYGQAVEEYLSMPSHLLIGKTVRTTNASIDIKSNVYCGGRMADVYSTVDALVKKEVMINTMFAGNDISGSVSGRGRDTRTSVSPYPAGTDLIGEDMTDATKPYYASTGLSNADAHVYVRIEPNAEIGTLFGGGNGDYNYSLDGDNATLEVDGQTMTFNAHLNDETDIKYVKPYQESSWLDIRGNIGAVYGGGNAANNKKTAIYVMGEARIGHKDDGSAIYGTNGVTTGAVYGGCKSADVELQARTLVAPFVPAEGKGTVSAPTVYGNVFGGCDYSGNVGDCNTLTACTDSSGILLADRHLDIAKAKTDATYLNGDIGYARVSLYGGTITGRLFGGGNGLYDYADGVVAPQVLNSWVAVRGTEGKEAIVGSTTGSETHTLFGGGQGAGTRVLHNVDVEIGSSESTSTTTINGICYGGSFAGIVNTSCDDHTNTTLLGMGTNTQVQGDIYGGSFGNYVRGKINLNINNAKVGVDANAAGIYAGNNNAAQPECEANINYVGNDCNVTLYGGGNMAPFYGTTRITFTTGEVGYIYGGGNMADVFGNTIVEVLGGHVCHDVFGGGNHGAVKVNKEDAEHPYGGNTLVIVRDDCLIPIIDVNGKNPGDDGYEATFESDALTGNRIANRASTLYSTKYFGNNDLDAGKKSYCVLQPNSAGIRSRIDIEGNVYGGGNAADVEGKATVIIGDNQE